jgi:hypothetical protein
MVVVATKAAIMKATMITTDFGNTCFEDNGTDGVRKNFSMMIRAMVFDDEGYLWNVGVSVQGF